MTKEQTSQQELEENTPAPQVPTEPEVNDSDRDLESALADADAARQNDELTASLAEAKAQVLRSQAELENFRKRMRREMETEQRYAGLPLIRDLLPVVDNLQRAVAAAAGTDSATGLVEGVAMVANHLTTVLEKHHCETIDPLGEPFDPNLHEAIAQQPSPAHEAGTVVHVAQIGYKLHDRVVRPAQVVVAAAPPPAEESASPSEADPTAE